MAVQGARQRWCLEHRHAVLGADRANAQGDLAHTLGQNLGRGHAALVRQCHGEMRWICDDDVSSRHRPHHPFARRLPLQLADPPLDLGVAFHFLAFLAHLFLGHLQLVVVLPELERHIDGDDQDHRQNDHQKAVVDQLAGRYQRRVNGLTEKRKEVVVPFPQHPDGNAANQQGLGDGFDQLGETTPGNQPGDALDRIQTAKIGVECLDREVPAPKDKRRKQGSSHQQEEKRSKSHQGIERQVRKAQHEELRLAHQLLIEREPAPQNRRRPLQHPRAGKPESRRGNHQNQECTDLARAGNLPFFAGLFEASG